MLAFYYRVVRAWTLPVEPLLTGNIWVMPLAAAAEARKEDLPEIVRLVDSRLSRETEPSKARIIMEMTIVLAGLQLDKATIQRFRQGLKTMTELKESSYYKLVHGEGRKEGLEKGLKQGLEKGRKEGIEKGREEGKIAGARTILLRLGKVRFGKPDKSIRAEVEAIDDLDRLEKMTERVLTAKSWRELIDIDLSERNYCATAGPGRSKSSLGSRVRNRWNEAVWEGEPPGEPACFHFCGRTRKWVIATETGRTKPFGRKTLQASRRVFLIVDEHKIEIPKSKPVVRSRLGGRNSW